MSSNRRRGTGRRSMLLLVLGLGLASGSPAADPGVRILEQNCAACHALQAPESAGFERIRERKGPDLHYAGVKFQADWLERWLQNPVRIRPGAELYTRYLLSAPEGDVIDESALPVHPSLSAEDAQAVAAALMELKGPEGLVEEGAFDGKPVPAAMGQMFFTKLRGCAACHSMEPGDGGESGPNLGTAGDRLQADFIYSYIKDPQRIDPHVWMPRQELSEQDLQRLTGHLVQQTGEEESR